MSRDEVYEKLSEVFEDVFDKKINLSDEMTAADVDGWDSLTHISLLSAVEDEFDIKFDMKTVHGLKNVGELVSLILELS